MAGFDKKSRASFALLAGALHYLLLGASAVTYDVSASGGSLDLSEAMSLAEAGDTVSLADGTYDAAIVSHRDGQEGSPITVIGGPGAIIKGDFSSRSVLINHSFITLKGFSVQGKIGSANSQEAYVNKCVYVEGSGDSSSPLDGFVMEGLTVENCGGECVRLKDSVVNALITGNIITNCGIHDYMFKSGDKNGEGVYVGTSSNQWINGPDGCTGNLVKGNRISTSGNECVDIKEGAWGNVVEDNLCSNQLDVNSGCYDSRGDDNIFRYNVGSDCLGAGVRLGGWEVNGHQYGVGNSVYGNDFSGVGNGALKVLVSKQGDICGNTCEDGSCALKGENLSGVGDTWNQACGDIGGPATSSFTAPVAPSTSSTGGSTSPSSSSSSPSGTTGDGSASDETSEGDATSFATPQSEGDDDIEAPEEDGDEGTDDDDDKEETDEEEEEEVDEEKEEEKEEEVAEEERKERERQEEERREEEEQEQEEEPFEEEQEDEEEEEDKDDTEEESLTITDSDDYGNDYGDDFDSDDDNNNNNNNNNEDDDDDDDDTAPTTADSDDYGNDYGDDFDADDESDRRGRRSLRGSGTRD